jgi:single-stranded DNA-binding protein
MSRGMNKWWGAGNVSGNITYSSTDGGTPTVTFQMACDRKAKDTVLTTWVKVNIYGHGLVEACRGRLTKGAYVMVDGELMNRDGKLGELTEVRAREIVFR